MTPQGKEFASLLFTPRTADKPNQPDYRSSRSVRSPSAGRASASGFGRLSSFRDSGVTTRNNLGEAGQYCWLSLLFVAGR
jgi:hypothetical protein